MKPGEVCKVRNDAVSREGKSYALAVFKRSNKKTARVAVLDADLFEIGEYLVAYDALWKLKASARRTCERRMGRKKSVVSVARCNETRDGLACVADITLSPSTTLTFVEGGVTDCTTGAIVNAANQGCLGGGGVDGEINRRGGPALWDARKALPEIYEGVRCRTGDAKMTVSGDLPCDYVIHAVGPDFSWVERGQGFQWLEKAYEASLSCAATKGVRTVAFCILSGGIFRGREPLADIIEHGICAIAKHATRDIHRVYFCGFTIEERAALEAVLSKIERAVAQGTWKPAETVTANTVSLS